MEVIDMKREIQAVFDPVADKFGLYGPIESKSNTYTFFSIGYMEEKFGFEVAVDLSDFFIYVLIFKTDNFVIPIGYKDKFGMPQKIYIQDALKKIFIEVDYETKQIQRLGGNYKNYKEIATIMANMVEEYWPLLKENKNRFFQANGRE